MRRELALALAIFLVILPFLLSLNILEVKAGGNTIWGKWDLKSANNTLTVSLNTFLGKGIFFGWFAGSGSANYVLIVTSYKDVNGTWVNGNWVKYNQTLSYAGWSASFSFQNLRPTTSAVAIKGKIIAQISSSYNGLTDFHYCGAYSAYAGYSYRITGDAQTGRIVVNVYSWKDNPGAVECSYWNTGETLISVFQTPNPDKTEVDFSLDFNTMALSYSVSGGLADTWTISEGCGDSYLGKTGAISVTIYSNDTASASNAINAINNALKTDSKGLVYVKEFEIKSGINLYDLAKQKNKTVDKLVPSDFYYYLPGFQSVTIIHIPSGYFSAQGIYAGSGLIFVHSLDQYVLLHEIAHGAGFCDPDPYSQWKSYWNSLTGSAISTFTNSTWYTKLSDGTKFWVTLETVPICPMTKSLNLVFSVKSDPSGKQFDYSIVPSLGSVNPSSGSGTTNTKVTASYTAPSKSETIAVDNVVFKLKVDNTEYDFPFLITVPKLSLFNSSLQNSWNPNQSIFSSNPYLYQLAQQALNLSSMPNNYTDPIAMSAFERAKRNFQMAFTDAQYAQKYANDSCRVALYQSASQARIQAGEAWIKVADYYQNAFRLFNYYFNYEINVDAMKQYAQQWEQKAQTLELQAQLGCPTGLFSSKFGINPLIGLAGLLSGSGSGFLGSLGTIQTICLVLGAILTGLGFLGMITKEKDLRKLFTPGILLLAIVLVIYLIAGG
jgi:hypothetical protein